MLQKKQLTFILTLLILSLTFVGCSPPPSDKNNNIESEIKPVSKTTFLMGTVCKITIYDQISDETVFTKAFKRIEEIENKMTINKPTEASEILKLNNNAGKKAVTLSADTFLVLEKGKYFSSLSQGKFDITIGPIVKLWNIDTSNSAVPKDNIIKEKLPLVNYENLKLTKEAKKAQLLKSNMVVDLGAIAKGYAADEVAKILKDAGVKHAIINLGGNILTLNTKPDGTPWRLGLQDPDPAKPRGDYMGIVKLKGQALVSSGTYEKYFEADGERYHHILDPQTGYPANNNLVSVSIITKNSLDADALSTGIFLLGLKEGMELIEKLEDTEAIFITKDKKVYISTGITEDNFEIVKDQFQLQE